MTSVDEIISYKKNPDEDFYAILNCHETATEDQIQAEFKVLALQYHPDKNNGEVESEAKFQKINEAKEILLDPAKRANYDKWRNSGIRISYKNWLGMKEHVHQSMHWVTPKTKDRMLTESTVDGGVGGGGGGAAGGLTTGPMNPAALRRASEGGAALYHGTRKAGFGTENSDVANKFRNYEI